MRLILNYNSYYKCQYLKWNNLSISSKNEIRKKRHVFLSHKCDGIFGYIRHRSNQLKFQRFLTLVRDFDILSLLDRWQSSCLRRWDLLHRGFRQKRAIYISRYTYVRFLRLDGISKRRDVSPTAMLLVEITRDYVRRNCSTCSTAMTK